mmetsp:Transcript_3427/g.5237  ORF Transcript_3427/g.5237 Transcript_3427/m.5237 type:complete len:116 (+) Transcript_3427:131-478(+)
MNVSKQNLVHCVFGTKRGKKKIVQKKNRASLCFGFNLALNMKSISTIGGSLVNRISLLFLLFGYSGRRFDLLFFKKKGVLFVLDFLNYSILKEDSHLEYQLFKLPGPLFSLCYRK